MKGGEMEDVAGRGRGVSLIWERGGEGREGDELYVFTSTSQFGPVLKSSVAK